MSRIITCEQVSDGHPDKICDQIADEILMYELRNRPTDRKYRPLYRLFWTILG